MDIEPQEVKNRKKRYIILLIAMSLICFIIGMFIRNFFPVAITNGEFIGRDEFIKRLLETAGKNTLDTIIIEKVVFTEAKKRKITVSTQEIQTQKEQMKKFALQSNIPFENYLLTQQTSIHRIDQDLKFQLTVKKMFAKDVKVTDQDYKAYLQSSNIGIGKGAIYESQKASIYEQAYTYKLRAVFGEWIQKQLKNTKTIYLIKV